MAKITLGTLALGGTDPATGVRVHTKRFAGWGGAGSTLLPQPKTRQHGAWGGEAFLAPLYPVLSGTVWAPTEAALFDFRDALAAAASLTDTILSVDEGHGTRWARVRRQGEVIFEKTIGSAYEAYWSVSLTALDPRRFGPELTVAMGLPSTVGGLRFPVRFPLRFPAATVTGQGSLTNPGAVAGPVRLRIDGPVSGPIVTHVSTGARLVFATSVVLGAGEFLTVDMETQQVLAQGESSRAGWVTEPGFSGFEPGVNTWAFTAAVHSAAAQLTVYATPAW